jgi:hypothetical protein
MIEILLAITVTSLAIAALTLCVALFIGIIRDEL